MYTNFDKAIATFITSAALTALAPIGINPTTSIEDAIFMLATALFSAFITWVVPNKQT